MVGNYRTEPSWYSGEGQKLVVEDPCKFAGGEVAIVELLLTPSAS
jgi:hypothetical protein